MQRVAAALVLLMLTAPAARAAAFQFGDDDLLVPVTDVKLPGPNGEKLQLARRLTTHNFMLPYSMDDEGYVLAVADASARYFALPPQTGLEIAQATGYLPKPLPGWQPGLRYWLIGHALWLTLAVFLLADGVKWWFKRQREAARMLDNARERHEERRPHTRAARRAHKDDAPPPA